ncbi:leucine-rich repeat-containing protein 66 [Anomaloglossus baeobatrachus]
MGISWLFVLTSFLLAGSVRGLETNFTSGCLWNNLYSLNCTSAGITNLQEIQKSPSWPRAPRSMKTMKHINLSNNQISSFHMNIFSKFLSLETLNISNNYISVISINYEQEGRNAMLASLYTLVLDRNRLTFVPRGLGKLTSLQTLQLSANGIVRIQRDDFANCTQLQNLDLGHNRIHKIDPDAFRDLRNLQVLRLSNNALVSITPLVFLYSYVLRADIDLSYNGWACDCRILPLKHLLTSLPVGKSKEWNVTCHTPVSRAGTHLLSVEHINGSCRSPVDKYIYARKMYVNKRDNIYLPCNITDKTGYEKTFWWTPQGIISGEPSITNQYIDKRNNFMITEPDRSCEGLYICTAGMERIVYQVHFQTEAETPVIRRPRDVQQLNTRIRTEQDFTLAVVLSVVITFLCAFLLGVFLRPYLERLWRKLCKSKDSKKKTSDEAYDNEGFSEENLSTRHSSNGPGSRLPMYVSKEKSSGSDSDFEEPDGKYEDVTYNEREIYYKDEPCVLDTHIPTRSEVQERRHDGPEVVEVKHKNVHTTSNSHSKRVTWASDEESSPKINLKNLMLLLKPINIIVPTDEIETTDNHYQNIIPSGRKPEHVYSDIIIAQKAKGSFSDSISSNGSEFWDAEDQLPNEDVIVKYVSPQQVGSASKGHVIPTVNLRHVMSLLKPINFIVPESTKPEIAKNHYEDLSNSSSQFKDEDLYDISLSDDGSHSSIEDHSSKRESIDIPKANKGNESPKANLKQVMSLLKPINIIVPEFTAYNIIKSPTQKQIFPVVPPRYRKYSKDNYSTQAPESQPTKDTRGKKALCDNSLSDDGSIDYDDSSDETVTLKPVLLPTMQTSRETKIDTSPTVNLKQVISLIKPINFIVPSTVSEIGRNPSLDMFYPSGTSRLPNYRVDESSSSDEGSAFDYDDSSDEEVKLNSGLPPTQQVSWTNTIDPRPTVKLQQVISLLKPISIIAPEIENKMDEREIFLKQYQEPGNQSQIPKYESSFPSSTRPPIYLEDSQTSSDSSSSEDESKEVHRSDERSLSPSVLLTTEETWQKMENTTPKVNLKHVISLLKPINIIIPDSTAIDPMKRPSQIPFSPTSLSRYPDHRMEDIKVEPEIKPNDKTPPLFLYDREEKKFTDSSSSDDGSDFDYDDRSNVGVKLTPVFPSSMEDSWTHNINTTVNLQQIMSLLKPISIISPEFEKKMEDKESQKPEYQLPNLKYENNFTSTRPINDFKDKETSSDSSSSDDESKEDHNVEDEFIIPSVSLPKEETWAKQQNVSPTVNLAYLMSLLKPINITIPESPKFDLVSRPSQMQFFPGSISKYPEHTSEDLENETSFVSHTKPPNRLENKETSSESSSSDEESNEDHSLDDKFIIPSVSLTNQETWAKQQNVSPTVNLKYVMSLLKPINVTIPETPKFDLVSRPSQIQFFPESISKYPEHKSEHLEDDNHFKSLTRPTSYMESKETSSDSSSSDEESKEHHNIDDGFVIPSVSLAKEEIWAKQQDVNSTVNLKHVMSLLKPINVIFPESPKSDQVKVHGEAENMPYNEKQTYNKNPIGPIIDGDGIKTFYDSSSSDDGSDFDYDDSSDEEVKLNSNLPLTKQASWTNTIDTRPTVNLQQVISLLKPISIIAPEFEKKMDSYLEEYPDPGNQSPSPTYENSFVSSRSPNIYSEGKQSSSDSSSSEDESKEDHSSDDGSIIPSISLTTQPTSTRQQVNPTVNLKHVMSLVKPIYITIPESPKSGLANKPLQTHFSPGSISRYPEHRREDLEHENSLVPSTRPTNHMEDKQISSDSSSSDDESKQDQTTDYVGIIPPVSVIKQTWEKQQKFDPTVNLKHVMSLLKPINITIPDSSKSPSQTEFFPGIISRYPDHRMEDKENLYYQETLSREPENEPYNQKQTYDKSPTLSVSDAEGKKTFYDSSSSDDDSKENHGSHDVIKIPPVSLTKQESWSKQQNVCPIVNLKHVMSLLKPINLIISESQKTDPLQTQLYPGSISRYPEHGREDIENEKRFVPSTRPTNYMEDKQMSSESSSSDDESKEDHSSDDESRIPPVSVIKQATWGKQQNVSPTVNLKHLMSLLKPINITIPESPKSDLVRNPLQTQVFPGNISRYPEHRMEDLYSDDSENKSHNIKQDNNSSTLPKSNEVGKTTFYDSSSSDDSKEDNSDEEVTVNPSLLITKQPSWTKKDENPKVNLKQVISLLKPISIIVPHSVIEPVGNPSQKQFFSTNSTNHEDKHSLSPTIIINDSKCEKTFYDTSSSEESTDDEANGSDEEKIKNSDLFITKQEPWTPKVNVSPTVNLKHAMSLVRPISIIAPNYVASENLQSPSQKQVLPSSIPRKPKDKIEDIQVSRGSEQQSHSENISPTRHKESRYDSSSSDDESKKDHRSDDGGLISYLPTGKSTTWTHKEVISPSFNLKQVMSLLKPINILSAESMTDLKIYYPNDHEYIKNYGEAEIQPQDPNYEKHYSETSRQPTKEGYKEIFYDSTSSEDDSDKGENNHSDGGVGMNSELLLTITDTWENTGNVSPNVNLKYVMSLVKPINIKVPDSTVTEALRRFQEKYNVEVRRYKTVNQLQNETHNNPPTAELNSPNSTRYDQSKHIAYEMDRDFDSSKINPKLLRWETNEKPNDKVNLKHVMSLLKPINIIAPDFIPTVAVISPEQKYFSNNYQSRDGMENAYTYHHHYHDQDNGFDGDSSRKHLNNTSYKGLDSPNSEAVLNVFNRSNVDESSQISYTGELKNSAPFTPKWTTPTKRDNRSYKLNLKQVMSLLKPISIAVPDSLSTDEVMSPTKVPVSERLSHNTISEYYTDNMNDSSSDDGSFFSFSQSNSISNEPEKLDIEAVKRNSKKESGKHGATYPKANVSYRDKELKYFAGGEYEPNKAKDVLHWLNTNTNDNPNAAISKTSTEQTPEQELVLDLDNQEWTTRTIVRKENQSMPTYFLPDVGETSTDGNLIDFSS